MVVYVLERSGSITEVLVRNYLPRTLLFWLKQNEEFSNVKIQEKVKYGAYSLACKQVFYGEYFEALEDLEPISPIAIIHINKYNMPEIDTKTIISDENLIKNVDEHRSGELSDELCGDCNLSLILHPNPKKHYCELSKQKKDLNEEDWKKVQFDLVNRLNKIVLMNNMNEKKTKEKDLTELLVNNLTILTEKIEKIATNSVVATAATKTQVVARRNCPAWTAGTSVDVYTRWVQDWNKNDTSDDLIKYMDITRSLSDNKVITGLQEYMKKIVMPSLSATGEENVEAVLEKLSDKYKKN